MSGLETIKHSFKSVRIKTKAFLRRQRWKEALVFFCFLLLSFGFWLLQSLQQEYEIGITIPVRYKSMPADIAFSGTTPHEIEVRIKDKGSVLLNYSFGRTFAPIEANMKDSKGKNGTLFISKKEIENDILKQLISTTSLASFEPQQIDAAYSKRLHKEVPVVFNGTIQTDAGFQESDEITIRPNMINVYASKAVLDTILEIKTVFTEVKKGTKTIVRNLQLQKIDGATLDPSVVAVTIPIEEYTEKTLSIPVVCQKIPPHFTVRMFPAEVKVICSVPLSKFKDLSEEEFAVRISFADLEQNVSGTIPITLSQKPDWVRTATLSPDKVEFILEQNTRND